VPAETKEAALLAWGAASLWELACKRKAGKAGRRDTRDANCAAVREGSGILPGASLPFAGEARSYKPDFV